MFASHSQIICTLFGVHIYFYGVILAFAIIIGTVVSEYISTRYYDLKRETIIDLAPLLILFGIIGARLYYCCLNYEFYLRFPTEILAIRHGGISIHGAIIGGIIGILIYSIRKKIPAIKLMDIVAPGLALAQSVGRWGNFFNSEAFGLPTNLPWKLYIAPQFRPIPYQNYDYFHPTFLYESILDLLIFGVLFFIIKTNRYKKNGNIALIYLILYSICRIFVEHLRLDSVLYIKGVSVAIIVSVIIMCLSFILLVLNNLPEKEKS